MYHIVKTKSKTKPYQVVLLGKNKEPLSTSEPFKSKQAAFKNISSQVHAIDNYFLYAQDDTTPGSILYKVYFDNRKSPSDNMPVKPKYIPGKNPKKKK